MNSKPHLEVETLEAIQAGLSTIERLLEIIFGKYFITLEPNTELLTCYYKDIVVMLEASLDLFHARMDDIREIVEDQYAARKAQKADEIA